MPWKVYEFKDQKVYARVLPSGKPIVHRGRVELRYKLGATKSYRASPANLVDIEGEIVPDEQMGGRSAGTSTSQLPRETPEEPADENTIVIYTDGACSGNPGPAGLGIYIQRSEDATEISEFIGSGTNNIAELTAILRALQNVCDEERERRIHVYTDSGWSLGVLVQGWKAKANLELIDEIKQLMTTMPNLELLKVRGHAGNVGNEEADNLATMAVRREDSMTRVRKRPSSTASRALRTRGSSSP
jgi:ribonuclease HI